MIDHDKIKQIVEAALYAADDPLSVDRLVKLFGPDELHPEEGRAHVRAALEELESENERRGVELRRVASGYRMQVKQEMSPWVSRLWDEKPPRYSRALLETLSLIAYRQPVTRGDIEEVRGVAVSTNIIRTLAERGWIREVGHREVPGRPALYGTTRGFLDYFNLKSLSELPPLAEIRELVEPVIVEEAGSAAAAAEDGSGEADAAPDGAGRAAAESAERAAQASGREATPPEAAGGGDGQAAQDADAPAAEPEADAGIEIDIEAGPGEDGDTAVEPEPRRTAEVVPLPRAPQSSRD
jgi:segregation and condensation protein B